MLSGLLYNTDGTNGICTISTSVVLRSDGAYEQLGLKKARPLMRAHKTGIAQAGEWLSATDLEFMENRSLCTVGSTGCITARGRHIVQLCIRHVKACHHVSWQYRRQW